MLRARRGRIPSRGELSPCGETLPIPARTASHVNSASDRSCWARTACCARALALILFNTLAIALITDAGAKGLGRATEFLPFLRQAVTQSQGTATGRTQQLLPRAAVVVLVPPAVALELPRPHDQALRPQRDELTRNNVVRVFGHHALYQNRIRHRWFGARETQHH